MGEAAGSGKEWFLKVVTDAGKRYSLEVKGDIATLSAEVVKPKLAEKTGVPARKQILTFKGKELGDKISFQQIGIKPDDELRLSRKVSEATYFIEVIGDSLSSFDSILEAKGGVSDFDSLEDTDKASLVKELGRKVKSLKKNLAYLREEDESHFCERQIAQFQALLSDKEHILNQLENPSLRNTSTPSTTRQETSPRESSTLIGRCREYSSPLVDTPGAVKFGLNSVMLAFYERLQWLHSSLYAARKRLGETLPVAGALLRVVFDLKILSQDVLSCKGISESELYIMQRQITEVRAVLIKLVAQFLSSQDNVASMQSEELRLSLTSKRAPYAIQKDDIPSSETELLDVLGGLDSGVVEAQKVLTVFKTIAGNVATPLTAPLPLSNDLAAAAGGPAPSADVAAPPPAAPSPSIAPTAGAKGEESKEVRGAVTAPVSEPSSPLNAEDALEAAIKAGDIWRARVVVFYQKYNPKNIESIDRILVEYKDAEDRLFTDLFGKYNVSDSGKADLQNTFVQLSQKHKIELTPPPNVMGTEDGNCTVM